jgi:hypothetical protein
VRISERLLTVLVLCLLVAAIPAHASGKGERELKQAQDLVEQKQYSVAMKRIVDIMKDYPDLREETDKLVARIMDVRRRYNEKYSELVEILYQEVVEERDVERGIAIIEYLRDLDPNPGPGFDTSLQIAERKLQGQVQYRLFVSVMREAAGEIAGGKYAEAIQTYLGGFAVSRPDFDAADYPQLLRDQALNDVTKLETVSKQAAAAQAEAMGLPNALATLLEKPATEPLREGFLGTLQPLLQAHEHEAQIRSLAASIREINAAIDAANGENAPSADWLWYVEQYALGRPEEIKPEGLATAVRQPWVDIARKLSETAYAAAEAAYAATEKAMAGEVDLEEFRRSAADARNRGLLALGVLNVEASAWQPAEGLVLSSDDRDRATTLSTRMSLIRQRMVDAEAWEPFIVAEVGANATLTDLERRLKEVPPPTGTDTNALGRGRTALLEIKKSVGDGEAEWRSKAASATPGSVMASRASAVEVKYTALGVRALEADAGLAVRIAGLEAAGFGPRRADAEARQVKGRALTAGTTVGQVPAGKWPDLANEEYVRALADIGALLSAIDAWQKKWTSERVLTASDEISRLLAEQSELLMSVVALQASITEDKALATAAIHLATQLRGQGDSAYQAGQTKVNQKNYVEALKSYTTARDSYTDSLAQQENAAARARLEELSRIIERVTSSAREQNLALVQELIDKGTKLYTEKDYEGAIAALEEARKLWEAAAGGENTTVTIYIERATAALKVTGKQEITRTDPIFEDIRGFMTQAELSFNRAESMQNTPSRADEYRSALTAARSSVQAITAVVPEYREARLLALKILRLELGPAEFEKELRAREDTSIKDAKNEKAGEITWRDAFYSLNAYKVYEKDAKRLKLINDTIASLEVKLGLRDAPIPLEKVRESANYYQQANAEYRKGPNDRFRWESALWLLQKSIDVNPLNKDAQTLRNQIAVKRTTLVDVLSDVELESARAANQDIINRNTSRAEAIIRRLLEGDPQNPGKPKNPLLLYLLTQIPGAR